MTRPRRSPEADITDEDSVLRAMARELDVEPDDMTIATSHMESFGVSPVWRVHVGRHTEYTVVADDDAARELALAVVTQDLEQEPELFNRDFIERHLDVDDLRRALSSDVESMAREDLDEENRQGRNTLELLEEAEGFGLNVDPYRDEEGELNAEADIADLLDSLAEKRAEERLRDPLDYLADIYGREDAQKQAIEIAGIDVEAAAEDAVSTDGWQHFLARYNGHSYEAAGLVYWRDN